MKKLVISLLTLSILTTGPVLGMQNQKEEIVPKTTIFDVHPDILGSIMQYVLHGTHGTFDEFFTNLSRLYQVSKSFTVTIMQNGVVKLSIGLAEKKLGKSVSSKFLTLLNKDNKTFQNTLCFMIDKGFYNKHDFINLTFAPKPNKDGIYAQIPMGKNILQFVVDSGNVEIAKKLLDTHNPYSVYLNFQQPTLVEKAQLFAEYQQNPAMLKLLEEKGAKDNSINLNEMTESPLQYRNQINFIKMTDDKAHVLNTPPPLQHRNSKINTVKFDTSGIEPFESRLDKSDAKDDQRKPDGLN